jgi:PadR family transcriptional regulator PadR
MPSVPGPLGEFEQLVLIALLRLGDRAYGVSIHADIVERTGRDVSLAAVYKTLERLEDKRYVSSALGEPTAERGGRRKKFFKLEPAGDRALRHALRALERMTSGLAWEWKRP